MSNSETPWTVARQASLSIINSWSLLQLMSTKLVMTSNHLILCSSSCLQPYPASGSFLISQFFASGGQSMGASASASVPPKNTQSWFPLGWTGWISLQSKGLSRVFSNTAVQQHQFFGAQLSLQSNFLCSLMSQALQCKTSVYKRDRMKIGFLGDGTKQAHPGIEPASLMSACTVRWVLYH